MEEASNATKGDIWLEIRKASVDPVPNWTRHRLVGTERDVWIAPDAFLVDDDVICITESTDTHGFEALVVKFGTEATERLEKVTSKRIDQPIAVLLHDEIINTPIVRSPINHITITQVPDVVETEVLRKLKGRYQSR